MPCEISFHICVYVCVLFLDISDLKVYFFLIFLGNTEVNDVLITLGRSL